jgi:outer membrane protein OmpA-like peptidoglycan-associated protein
MKDVRFLAQGFGATHPVAPNAKPDGSDDPEGRQKNRRVEIVLAH